MGMSSQVYRYNTHPDVSWICCPCGMPKFSTSLFESFTAKTSNIYDSLSTDNSISSTVNPGSPLHASSPKNRTANSPKHKFRIISLNMQSIRAKHASFLNLVDSVDPDVIVGTETWLRPDVHDSEFLPPGYVVRARRDRQDGYGGVIIISKCNVTCGQLHISKNSELVAISVKMGSRPLVIIMGLYRPPSSTLENAEGICEELHNIIRACTSQYG